MPTPTRDPNASSRKSPPLVRSLDAYNRGVCEPIRAIIIALPLAALFEITTVLTRGVAPPGAGLVAQRLVETLFASFGIVSRWLPAAALVVTLAAWQFMRGRTWRVRPLFVTLMLIESVLLAVPIVVLNRLLIGAASPGHVGASFVRCTAAIGGAVYEELVFRLFMVWGLVFVLKACRVSRAPATTAAAAVLSGFIFAGCHIQPIGVEPMAVAALLLRLAAGVYLAAILLRRGFGIAVGTHAAYNVCVVLLRFYGV